MIREYEAVLDGRFVRSLPITLAVLKRAARIRSEKTSLPTPDAIHLATSIEAGCSRFITNDAAFRKVHDLGVLVLDDFMA